MGLDVLGARLVIKCSSAVIPVKADAVAGTHTRTRAHTHARTHTHTHAHVLVWNANAFFYLLPLTAAFW